MNKAKSLIAENIIYIFFSYIFTFFLLCSYVFSNLQGFVTFKRLILILTTSIFITPFISLLFIWLSQIRINLSKQNQSKLATLFTHQLFYFLIIFFLQLPVFLAFYPGICYYDINTQVEQFETSYFVLNHPLIHTMFIGYFKNLFHNPNTGYAISTLIQMFIMDGALSYLLSYIYKKKHCVGLCTFGILFYGIFPVNTLLIISSTKDILFAAFVIIFFIDMVRLLFNDLSGLISITRFALNIIFMLLLRNNAIYAFILSLIIFLLFSLKKHKFLRRYVILFIIILFGYIGANSGITHLFHAVPGSIKETLSIPSQQLARIYQVTENEKIKEKILSYIPEPDKYCYYLSDAIKEQLPFDVLDSSCKHFLLDTAVYDLMYPIPCLDAAFYNVQGYWDILHSPYQSEHFFLASDNYRGGATLDSKFPMLSKLYIKLFNRTEQYDSNPIAVLGRSALYIWLFLFCLLKAIKEKNKPFFYSCLFPLFYLLTLLFGPGAIIRYSLSFILLTPALLSTFLYSINNSTQELE